MNTATLNSCTVPELLRLAEGTDDPLARSLADEMEAMLGETGEWESERDRLHDEINDLEARLNEAESQWETAADDHQHALADAEDEKQRADAAEEECTRLEAENEGLRARVLELENGL